MKNRAPDHRQARLPLTRDERLAAIDTIDPADYGIGPRAWRTVRDLLRQIEFQSARSAGCYLRVEVLAARLGVSERTVQRTRRIAEAAGLLVVHERAAHNGQLSNEWLVDWCHLAGRAAVRTAELSPPGDKRSPTPDKLSPMGDMVSPPLRNRVPSSVPKTVPRSSDDGATIRRDDHERDWEWVRAEARRLSPKLGRCVSPGDRSLLLKAIVLSRERFGEHWLHDAIEGARLTEHVRRSRYAILHECLDQKCVAVGTRLNRELVGIEVPAELLRPPARAQVDERLCQ